MSADLPISAVLGSGTMGAGIALSLALGGATVRLWGRRAEALPAATVARRLFATEESATLAVCA